MSQIVGHLTPDVECADVVYKYESSIDRRRKMFGNRTGRQLRSLEVAGSVQEDMEQG